MRVPFLVQADGLRLMLRVWYTLSHQDNVHWANCTVCRQQFEYTPGPRGVKRLIKWMTFHRLYHSMLVMDDDLEQ